MNKSVKIAIEIGLAVVICLLIFLTVKSVQKPVEFKKEVAARTQVAVQRLKDIRTLQEAFKSVNGRFSPSVDSLKLFHFVPFTEMLWVRIPAFALAGLFVGVFGSLMSIRKFLDV